MKNRTIKFAIILGVAIAAGAPAIAERPDSPGHSQSHGSSQKTPASSAAQANSENSRVYFTEERRVLIRNYYSKSQQHGNCPPGLAKKNNGCQPPGQVKKWRKGEPLLSDTVYYDLPGALIEELGRTPEGNKLVQVDTDLLLLNIATGIVLEAFAVQE